MEAVRWILLALLLLSWLCDCSAMEVGSRRRSRLQSRNRSHHQGKASTPRPIGMGTVEFSDKKHDTPYLRKVLDLFIKDLAFQRFDSIPYEDLLYGPRNVRSVSENTSQTFLKNETSRLGNARIPRWVLHRCHSAWCKEAKFKVTRPNSDIRRYPVYNSSVTVRERIGDDGDMMFEQIKETLKRTLPQFGRFLIPFDKFPKDENAPENPNVDGSLFIGYLSMTSDKFPKNKTEGGFLFTLNIPKDNSTIFIGLYENATDFPNVSATTDAPNAFTNFQVLLKMNDSRVLFEQTDQSDQSSVTVNDTFVNISNVNKSEKINSFEDKLIPETSEEILAETKLLEIKPTEPSITYFNSPEYVEHTKLLTDSQSEINETDILVNKFHTNSSPWYISYWIGFTLSNSETEVSASPEISFSNSLTNAYEEKSEILYKNPKMEEATTENYGELNETLTNKIDSIPSTIPDYGSTEKETVGTMDHVTLFEVSNVLSPYTPVIIPNKPTSKIAQKSPQNNRHITGFNQTSNEKPETYVVRTIPVVKNNTGKIYYYDVNVSKHILKEENYDNLAEYEQYIVFLREYVHNRRGKRSLTRMEFGKAFRSYFSKGLMMRKPSLREVVSEVMYVPNKRGKRSVTKELVKHFKSTSTPNHIKVLDVPFVLLRALPQPYV